MRRCSLALALVVVLAGCGGQSHAGAAPTTTAAPPATAAAGVTTVAPVTTTAPSTTAAPARWVRLADSYPRPKLEANRVGYQLDNGRILWVDEATGVGDVVANPDETKADQWSCAALIGPAGPFYDRYRGVPNFRGVVCRSYASAQ